MGIAEDFATALAGATKDLRTEKKRRERDARRAVRTRRSTFTEEPIKYLVYRVLPAAIVAGTGNGTLPVSARSLYYQVRPRLQELTDRELGYSYFSQTLLPEYQRDQGIIAGLYHEPRGELHEPHTRVRVPLGTREVAGYTPTEWTYDKALYVEKQGLYPVLAAAGLAERYDMAIIAGQGYATEAARTLVAAAEHRAVRIFVLHDADPDGYNIARTLAEETARMPDHLVEVVDLGLTVADAIAHQLPTESFTRRKELPVELRLHLDEVEGEWFQGQMIYSSDRDQWSCTRVELNAFSSPALIAYIEAGLAAHDATGKVIPPDDVLTSHAHKAYDKELADTVDELLAELIDRDRLLATLATEMPYEVDPVELREHVTDALAVNRRRPWGDPAAEDAADTVEDHREQLRSRLVDLLADTRPDREIP